MKNVHFLPAMWEKERKKKDILLDVLWINFLITFSSMDVCVLFELGDSLDLNSTDDGDGGLMLVL